MPRPVARALAILLLAPCLLAVYDAVILATSWERLHAAAGALAASIAISNSLAQAEFAPFAAYAQSLAQPEDVTRRGAVIVTAILHGPDGSSVAWRQRAGGGADSRYGAPGGMAELAWRSGDAPGVLIAAELAAPLSPFVLGAGWLRGLTPVMLRAAAVRAAR